MSRRRATEETDKLTRIAIVSADKCKPKRCRQECKKSCPVVRMGKLCIEVTPNSKIAAISEELCIGCGICVKVSSEPFGVAFASTLTAFRNARSKLSPLLIYPAIWRRTLRIDMVRTRLSSTDCRFQDRARYWGWLGPMVSENRLP